MRFQYATRTDGISFPFIVNRYYSFLSVGKKGRSKFVGAQGSGDGAQKDAAKLDVAQRVAAQVR